MQTQRKGQAKFAIPQPWGQRQQREKNLKTDQCHFQGQIDRPEQKLLSQGNVSIQMGQNKRSYPQEPISFSEEYLGSIIRPHECPLIIEVDIGDDCKVGKIMIDNSSTMDILYYSTFVKMGLKREQLRLTKNRCTGSLTWPTKSNSDSHLEKGKEG